MPLALTPPAYLRLRRRAAGLSLEEAARRLATSNPSLKNLREARELLDLVEQPGTCVRLNGVIAFLTKAYPFDTDVYRQLRDDPVERHPTVCRSCGCSKFDPCVSQDGCSTCGWEDVVTCTNCAELR